MVPGRLTKALTMTVQIVISLVMFIIVLPFFILWRLPISLLYLTKKEPEEKKNVDQEKEKKELNGDEEEKEGEQENEEGEPNPKPRPDAHARALAPYTKVWTSFKTLSINKPLVTHWSRTVCATLLLIQTILSLALLEKSLVYHIPWFVTHLSNTQYKTEKKRIWWNDLLLHTSGLVITCAPFLGLMGMGLGILYYARKVWVYGKFKKSMVRRQGGRGYEMPEKEGEDGGSGKSEEGHGVKEVIMGVVEHVMHPHLPHLHFPHSHLHAEHEQRQGQLEVSPYGYPEYSEDILFEQPGDALCGHQNVVEPPQPVMVQPPESTAWYDKNPYTLAGIQSIWPGRKEKLKTGYNGRDTRRQNVADDIEMADRVGMK